MTYTRKPQTKLIDDNKVLDSEKGDRFYYRALSPKAKARKHAKRKKGNASRRRNR